MKELIVGVDIGVKTTTIGYADKQGNVVKENTLQTEAYPLFDSFIKAIIEDITLQRKEFSSSVLFGKSKILGIGVGAPGANYFSGRILKAANLPWGEKIDVRTPLEKEFKTTVVLVNDANAVTIAEKYFGAARGEKDCIVLTLGTGLGMGIIADDKLLYGCDGFAGEGGHMIVIHNGRDCGCGRKGCLETYASVKGFRTTTDDLLSSYPGNSVLKSMSGSGLSGTVVDKAASMGDELAKKIFDYTGEMLALGIANMVTITSPRKVVLFGGIARSGDSLLKPVKKYLPTYLLNAKNSKLEVVISRLHDKNAALLGAIAVIMDELGLSADVEDIV